MFRSWGSLLPRNVQLAPVQLPGREQRMAESAFASMDALVPAVVDGIRTHLDRPFAIFGHSMGALVAYEVTRALRRAGLRTPVRLFVSGHRAPQLLDRRPPLHLLRGEAFLDALRALDGTPEEVLQHAELMSLVEPLLRADFQLCETYVHREERPLDVPLSVFGGEQDANVDRDELEAWRNTSTAPMTLRVFPGGHLYLHQERETLVAAIAEELGRRTDR